ERREALSRAPLTLKVPRYAAFVKAMRRGGPRAEGNAPDGPVHRPRTARHGPLRAHPRGPRTRGLTQALDEVLRCLQARAAELPHALDRGDLLPAPRQLPDLRDELGLQHDLLGAQATAGA